LRDTVLPNALRAILGSPLASARRLLPFPTTSALFRHASSAGGQVCHPCLNCLFWLKAVLPKTEEKKKGRKKEQWNFSFWYLSD